MLIHGINPLVISKITWCRGRRVYGKRNLWYKAMAKRHPIKAFFGLYDTSMNWSCWESATVEIRGSNGNVLWAKGFSSNIKAEKYHYHLNEQLSEFISSLPKGLKE